MATRRLPETLIVRPPVRDRAAHLREVAHHGCRGLFAQNAGDPAHG
jgi:hypothetical protein